MSNIAAFSVKPNFPFEQDIPTHGIFEEVEQLRLDTGFDFYHDMSLRFGIIHRFYLNVMETLKDDLV